MQVMLDRLEQSYPLDGGPVLTYLILTLPSGSVVKAQVTSEAAQKLIEASVNGSPVSSGPREESTFALVEDSLPEPPAVTFDEGSADEELEWGSLPDDVLAPVYKQVMHDLGVPALLPLKEFERVTDEISSHLRAQAEAQAAQKPKAVPHVIPRQRRVASDEYGYPVVPGLRQAPVEQGHDSDEDGVAQL
jgi:hypothetical protein